MEFRKMVTMTLYVRQQKRHRYKNKLLDSVGEGEGEVIWENHLETCIYEIDHQSKFDAWNSTQSWCTGTTQRDGMGREVGGVQDGGTHVHLWLIHGNVWPPQYCKVISLQLNQLKTWKLISGFVSLWKYTLSYFSFTSQQDNR